MPYNPPYDWDAMLAFLGAQAVPGVESVDDGVYRRTVSLDGDPGLLEIGPGGADHLLLTAHLPYWEGVIHVAERAAVLVGLRSEPLLAQTLLAANPTVGPLLAVHPGVRVPGVWGPFEVAAQTVVRDHLPEQAAYDVLRKLVEVHGMPVPGLAHGLTHAFPSAEALVGDELIGPLAQAVAGGTLILDIGESAEALIRSLEVVPGVSSKAAHHVALRLGARAA
ncbi:AlkA N-terminal domain-containing protein [Kribbella sp. NPDC050124]|uniref:AlkA N-terminal domain-containing protein n=1 Tax=Kribbella sp. NPDC050124 TaxID=3364114 RepID=UPI0037B6D177